jgi:DNA-binding NarL/FixJ family response regulator
MLRGVPWGRDNTASCSLSNLVLVTFVPLRIYIVEDNVVIRDNLAATLVELADAVICGGADGETVANTWLREHPDDWDLLIVDIFLKQGNGLGVITANRVRADHQKLVVLTNYASPEIRAQCLKLGADAVFDKSHDIENLLTYCLEHSGG